MKYKTYKELKEELGDKYDKYMYDINIELMKKIYMAIEYIKGAYEMACYTQSISLEQENIEDLLEILKGDK